MKHTDKILNSTSLILFASSILRSMIERRSNDIYSIRDQLTLYLNHQNDLDLIP